MGVRVTIGIQRVNNHRARNRQVSVVAVSRAGHRVIDCDRFACAGGHIRRQGHGVTCIDPFSNGRSGHVEAHIIEISHGDSGTGGVIGRVNQRRACHRGFGHQRPQHRGGAHNRERRAGTRRQGTNGPDRYTGTWCGDSTCGRRITQRREARRGNAGVGERQACCAGGAAFVVNRHGVGHLRDVQNRRTEIHPMHNSHIIARGRADIGTADGVGTAVYYLGGPGTPVRQTRQIAHEITAGTCSYDGRRETGRNPLHACRDSHVVDEIAVAVHQCDVDKGCATVTQVDAAGVVYELAGVGKTARQGVGTIHHCATCSARLVGHFQLPGFPDSRSDIAAVKYFNLIFYAYGPTGADAGLVERGLATIGRTGRDTTVQRGGPVGQGVVSRAGGCQRRGARHDFRHLDIASQCQGSAPAHAHVIKRGGG